MSNLPPATIPPKSKCRFGRDHQWSAFVYLKGRYCCAVCGIEQDEAWWDDEGRYIGPEGPVYADISNGGWLLRQPEPIGRPCFCDFPTGEPHLSTDPHPRPGRTDA